jgi:hypothetical protein
MNKRSKRAINIIGKLYKFAFGTLDSEDRQLINDNFNKNDKNMQNLADEMTAEKQVMIEATKQLENIEKVSSRNSENLRLHEKASIIIRRATILKTLTADSIKMFFNKNYFTTLIKIQQLDEILNETKKKLREEETILYINSIEWLKFEKMTSYVSHDCLIISIKLPILNSNTWQMNEIVASPSIYNNSIIKTLNLRNDRIIARNTKIISTNMSSCKYYDDRKFICNLMLLPIIDSEEVNDCITAIMNTETIHNRLCESETISGKINKVTTLNVNNEIYIFPFGNTTLATIACEDEIKTLNITDPIKIKFIGKCVLNINDQMEVKSIKTSTTNVDYENKPWKEMQFSENTDTQNLKQIQMAHINDLNTLKEHLMALSEVKIEKMKPIMDEVSLEWFSLKDVTQTTIIYIILIICTIFILKFIVQCCL